MNQNRSDLLTKLAPIAFLSTAGLWLLVILLTELPVWTLAVFVAVSIPVLRGFTR